MTDRPLHIVELGGRIAVGACGAVLQQLGADVTVVDARDRFDPGTETKFEHPVLSIGKEVVLLHDALQERSGLVQRIAAADAVLVSSDVDPAIVRDLLPHGRDRPVMCDITGFGATGPMAGHVVSDRLVQALAGLMETTGFPDREPVAVSAPIVEFSTALYAAAGVLAAVRYRRLGGDAQTLDVALFDCAVNALATFLPAHFGGGTPRRLGNRHSMAAPWNAYQAQDGWVLVCSTSERHWKRICEVIGRPELAADPRYAALNDRMVNRDEVDAIVGEWAAIRPVAACVEILSQQGIACGPIVPVSGLASEPNLAHRGSLRGSLAQDGRSVLTPTLPLGRMPPGENVPRRAEAAPKATPSLPLEGVRIIELGQFTTAPLAGRHLAMLGAEVIKVEPPDGDPARLWAPHQHGLSYFFVLSNSGKRCVALDLRSPEGASHLKELIATSDVLLENMKPGSLERLGFSAARLREINPRLVYCAISGFGADSAYPERPAFDTVVQAMSGLMDLTRDRGVPVKTGVSIADICGGELALAAILAALEERDVTGLGRALDLSMQDIAAWLTQLSWHETVGTEHGSLAPVLACRDGYVALDDRSSTVSGLSDQASSLSRTEIVDRLALNGVPAAAVQTISEVVADPQTEARQLIETVTDRNGAEWPLLRSPLRFSGLSPRLGRPATHPAAMTAALAAELGLPALSGNADPDDTAAAAASPVPLQVLS